MREKEQFNNPKKVFKEKGGLAHPGKKPVAVREELASIRRSEITSVVPDDINWNKIFAGKKRDAQRAKPGKGPR